MVEIKVLASSSAGNAYKVADLLLDAGLSYKELQRRLNFQVSGIAGVLLSHSHADHSKAIKDLMRAEIDCYMGQETADALKLTGHRLKVVKPKQQFKIGNYWTILPFELQHDVFNLGYLLENKDGDRLLYATDTFYVRYKFPGLNYILIECNYCPDILRANVEAGTVLEVLKNRPLKSHFSLPNVKEFLRANDLSKVQEIHLIHLSDGNSDAERFKQEIAALTGKPVYVAEK